MPEPMLILESESIVSGNTYHFGANELCNLKMEALIGKLTEWLLMNIV